jgi:glycosyltransferase involved in cell wall biosynthesis
MQTAFNLASMQEASEHRLMILVDKPGATQHISFTQPLMERMRVGTLEVSLVSHDSSMEILKGKLQSFKPSHFILSRYTSADATSLIEYARSLGIPVIFHIDDDLLKVPESLGPDKFRHYNAPERLQALRNNMEASDLIYTSTRPLAEAFKSYGISSPIIAGEVYCTVDPATIPEALPATAPVVGYMGTGGHSLDLALVLPILEQLMDEIPDLRFEVFGTIQLPQELARFKNRVVHHAPVSNYASFVSKLCELGWWIGLAPLEDNSFNQCKADTKWVEYSYAGIPVVASDLPVYHQACAGGAGILATDLEDWYKALKHLLNSSTLRHKIVDEARQKLSVRYSHSGLETQILNVLSTAYDRAHRSQTAQGSGERNV